MKAVAAFLEETELTKKAEDLGRVDDRVELLHRVLPKIYLQDIERADLLKIDTIKVVNEEMHWVGLSSRPEYSL